MSEEPTTPHQPPFAVPSVEEMSEFLPQYAFEKLAAFGGMGAVYKAKQESLDRPVAIKILPPEFGAEKEFAERFKAEARAMAKLNHTHIVAVYDFGITKSGHLYLVMEWVQGHTLHEIIHKGSLPVRRAANLGMQLCDALAYAHAHQILHRDIKPGNIMVTDDEQVKVADFGLARPITGEAEENPYGTPDYAAPEILGKGAVDQRVDIYAAGVVLYEMLTGRVPQKPRRSVQEFAPVSSRWDELIEKATNPEPAKRFQDARDFRAHIAQLINQAAQAAVPVAEVVEESPAAKSGLKPLHLVFIGAAVVIAGIVLAVMFQGNAEPQPLPEPKTASSRSAKAKPEVEPEEKKPKAKPDKKPEPVVVMPEPEPEKKKTEPETPAKTMATAPPVPVAPTMPAPTPKPLSPEPENPLDAILKLEELDPELAKLVEAFGDEWASNAEIDTEPEVQELAGKYIPALQRSLTGLMPEQRDHVLSEISHIANQDPLNEPEPSWPPVLGSLRKTYEAQIAAIRTTAAEAARRMRSDQCELMLSKARERADAGKTEAAKRAEAVAAELAKLRTKPTLAALKQSAAAARR